MKKIIAIGILLSVCSLACAQADSLACLKFHTGTFAYRNDSLGLIHINRTNKRQEEINKEKGIITKFRIKWTGACSYELKQVWSNSKKQRKQNGAVNKVIITSATSDSYQFSCACKNIEEGKNNTGIVVLLTQ
ncbi:MAG: hypothetical protein H7Y86_04755 [Rhizobacter sp.]|nr:hypothetical protein [Ferruginibacter sp.]